MKTKLSLLTLAMAMTPTSHAIYNLYNSDGTTFDIHGEVNVQGINVQDRAEVAKGAFYVPKDGIGTINKNYQIYDRADQRTRLGADDGASWLEFRGSQKITDDVRATGVMGFGYQNTEAGAYLNTGFLAIDKKNTGAVSLGRQYLHSGYVARTGTFSALDVFGTSALRADYTGINGLHLSGYYNFPATDDVNKTSDTDWRRGYGASASYVKYLNHGASVRMALGYTTHDKNPINPVNVPIKSDGQVASVELRKDRLMLAVDVGQSRDTFGEASTKEIGIKSSANKFIGAKAGYELTPQITFIGGVGKQFTSISTTPKYDTFSEDALMRAMRNNAISGYDHTETLLGYVRADYYMRENARFYVRADKKQEDFQLRKKTRVRTDKNEYRVGVTLSF